METIHVYTIFWLSLNSLNLPEGRDTFQMIQKHPIQCRKFLGKKELSGQSENLLDILESFFTIWKPSRHSGNFLYIIPGYYRALAINCKVEVTTSGVPKTRATNLLFLLFTHRVRQNYIQLKTRLLVYCYEKGLCKGIFVGSVQCVTLGQKKVIFVLGD